MATPYCPKCDSSISTPSDVCGACGKVSPVEGWPADSLIGEDLDGTYAVKARLGSGGFGVVYLAENRELGGRRALKVLHSRHVHNDAILRRFKREAKALYRLQSPYTVRLERWGRTEEGHYFLVMEYADGETLRDLLDREGRLSEKRALEITRQIAIALADAHELDIVHRDLKPENIVIRAHRHIGNRIAVLDFGISKILSDETSKQRSGLVGTPAYMAPELWKPSLGEANIRADLWSLGLILFEMVTGELPFDGETTSEPMGFAYQAINLGEEVVENGLANLSFDGETKQLIARLLVPSPDERLQTPADVLDLMGDPAAGYSRARPTSGDRAVGVDVGTADTMPDPRTGEGNQLVADGFSFEDEPPESLRIDREEDGGSVEGRQDPGGRLWILFIAAAILGGLAWGTNWLDGVFGDADVEVLPDLEQDIGYGTGPEVSLPSTLDGRDGTLLELYTGGAFIMGREGVAGPEHRVSLDPYYLDEHTVTVAQWQRCIDAEACSWDAEECDMAGELGDSVTCVDWYGAERYCRHVGRRLATEAEWELATQHVEHPLELDGRGEWVLDWYSADYYQVSPARNPRGTVFGFEKVVRGLVGEDEERIYSRAREALGERSEQITFRCALDAR